MADDSLHAIVAHDVAVSDMNDDLVNRPGFGNWERFHLLRESPAMACRYFLCPCSNASISSECFMISLHDVLSRRM